MFAKRTPSWCYFETLIIKGCLRYIKVKIKEIMGRRERNVIIEKEVRIRYKEKIVKRRK